MCAVRVYWQNKDFAMESWHNVLERPSWRSCAPPAFLLLPRSRKFNSQFSRPDMDAPQVECLETRKHTEHKTKSTSCGIAHCVCVCVYSMLPTSGHVSDSENPAQCLLPLCPRWRSASWARAKGWWIYDERLLTMKDSSKSLHTKTIKNHTLQDSPWPTSPSHLAKQSGRTNTPAESDSKPPASVHHVALAHRFQDVPRVSCDSLCLKMSKKLQDFYTLKFLKIDGTWQLCAIAF